MSTDMPSIPVTFEIKYEMDIHVVFFVATKPPRSTLPGHPSMGRRAHANFK